MDEFLSVFANQFDDTDPSDITPDTNFHDLDEWSSILGLSTIALAKVNYGKTITGAQIKECVTVTDLYNLISNM